VRTFTNVDEAPHIRMAGNKLLPAAAQGDTVIEVRGAGGATHTFALKACLHIPDSVNLISLDQLLVEGQAERFSQTAHEAHLTLSDGTQVPLQKRGGLVWMEPLHQGDTAFVTTISKEMLHLRMGHAGRPVANLFLWVREPDEQVREGFANLSRTST
jgi:hypothetical protein